MKLRRIVQIEENTLKEQVYQSNARKQRVRITGLGTNGLQLKPVILTQKSLR
jgi:hypothetical protein